MYYIVDTRMGAEVYLDSDGTAHPNAEHAEIMTKTEAVQTRERFGGRMLEYGDVWGYDVD